MNNFAKLRKKAFSPNDFNPIYTPYNVDKPNTNIKTNIIILFLATSSRFISSKSHTYVALTRLNT